jgi:hypothetical protein
MQIWESPRQYKRRYLITRLIVQSLGLVGEFGSGVACTVANPRIPSQHQWIVLWYIINNNK